MHIKQDFKIREIAGEHIIVNQGQAGADLTRIISLNSSAKLLFDALSGKEFDSADAAKVLSDSYGIDDTRAAEDAAKWIESLMNCGIIE